MNIEVKNISHHYNKTTIPSLEKISFEIKEGSKHGIFGANGAGKSTLIKILCNVIKPKGGQINYIENNIPIINQTLIKQSIGYVPQDFAFYEELTIWQNVKYFGSMFNLDLKTIKTKYEELIQLLGLTDQSNKKVLTFSGGMKRKVNLILGLLHNPSIIILDEPIVGIDAHSKYDILNHLNKLNENGKTIIYTSHQMNESQSFCEDFTLLHKGKLIVTGNLEEILEDQGKKDLESILLTL